MANHLHDRAKRRVALGAVVSILGAGGLLGIALVLASVPIAQWESEKMGNIGISALFLMFTFQGGISQIRSGRALLRRPE